MTVLAAVLDDQVVLGDGVVLEAVLGVRIGWEGGDFHKT